MRSLLVAPTLPSDEGNGLAMRIGLFLEALCCLGEVEVIVLPIFASGELTNAFCRRLDIRPKLISIAGRADTEFLILSSLTDSKARLEAFERYGRPSLSAYLSVPVLQDIRIGTRRPFDLIHVARLYLLPAIGAWPKDHRPPISVDLDEDDGTTQRRIAKVHSLRGDEFAARWLEAEAEAFDRLSARWLPQADVAFVSTEAERDEIASRHPGVLPIAVPNAVALPPETARNPEGCALRFVGGFGYLPNLDAALWTLEEIFPRMMKRCGNSVSLTLVGRNAPRELKALAARVRANVLETVDDLAPIYADASVALVPLRAGGGSRMKVIEAAAHGVPIVATTIGAENSGLRDGHEIWVADSPDGIVEACVDVVTRPQEARRRAEAARAFVATSRSRDVVISTLARHFASKSVVCEVGHHGGAP